MKEFLVIPRASASVLFAGWLVLSVASFAQEKPPSAEEAARRIFAGDEPRSLAELQAMDRLQQTLARQAIVSTVEVQVRAAHGSGVAILSPNGENEGYILTAGHVAGKPGRDAVVTLANGGKLPGKTLGVYRSLDVALVKVEPSRSLPPRKLAVVKNIPQGMWCMAVGHPGGYQTGRPPVVRVGRVLLNDGLAITTDCTLVGGDSGGPLFGMNGEVIGVNSRIGRSLSANIHSPVQACLGAWDRLVQGDAWGRFPGVRPYIGVRGASADKTARVAGVDVNTPAEKAGLKAGDVILRFDGKKIENFDALVEEVLATLPGERVVVEVLREDRRIKMNLMVGNRENS